MSVNGPLISIVIPTYNHANFLKAAIESVIAQTYQNWHAIIVNNFSDDDTIERDNEVVTGRAVGIDHRSQPCFGLH